jgi:hypothetical protein
MIDEVIDGAIKRRLVRPEWAEKFWWLYKRFKENHLTFITVDDLVENFGISVARANVFLTELCRFNLLFRSPQRGIRQIYYCPVKEGSEFVLEKFVPLIKEKWKLE